MVTENYVSPEIAKLLKERGFDGECRDYYSTEGHFYSEDFKSNWNDTKGGITLFSAPTLQMVMKWLREVHHIYIQINLYLVPKGYGADIIHIDSMDTLAYVRKEDESQYDTYEQAAEAAIKYYLENLI